MTDPDKQFVRFIGFLFLVWLPIIVMSVWFIDSQFNKSWDKKCRSVYGNQSFSIGRGKCVIEDGTLRYIK